MAEVGLVRFAKVTLPKYLANFQNGSLLSPI
jgi:hypothetical protein